MERKKRTNKNKTTARKSRTQGRLGPYLSMRARHGDKYFKITPSALRLPLHTFSQIILAGGRKEDDSLPRKSHDNNARAGRSPRKRQKERERAREKNGSCEDTPSEQSGAGSRNIFQNLNRLLETTGPARRRVDMGEVERGRPEGGREGGEGERRRGRAFSRGYSR